MSLHARYPAFSRLWLANVSSMLGDWLTYVAVGVLALGDRGGLEDVAIVQLAHTLPQIAGAPIAGWLSDRFDRRRLIIVASIARGALTLAMAAAALQGELGWLEGLLFLRMAGAAFVTTPSTALVAQLVRPKDLPRAHVQLGLAWAVVFTAGVALGGIVSSVVGPVVALAADALTFVVAAMIVASIRLPHDPQPTPAQHIVSAPTDHPAWVRLSALKVPAQLASGAAFVAVHALVASLVSLDAALALAALHALRGLANGVAASRISARASPERIASIGSWITLLAPLALAGALVCDPRCAQGFGAIGALAWGAGSAASWIGASAAQQQQVPARVLGRYTALDQALAALASALGAIGFVAITSVFGAPSALAITALVTALAAIMVHSTRGRLALALLLLFVVLPSTRAQAQAPGWLEDALDARAVTDDDYVRRELFSWTSASQAEQMARDGRLLRSGPGDGVRAPYQRALDALAAREDEGDPDVALARLLSEDPRVSARRYAWTTPYGAVLPLRSRSYGPILVRIDLGTDAWFARFAPDETPAFTVRDGSGATIDVHAVLGSPERLASVLHVRGGASPHGYREIIVHGAVQSWSMGTPEIVARIEADRRTLSGLLRALGTRVPRSMVPTWSRRDPTGDLPYRFGASMPFDTRRHRPSREALTALEEALRDRVLRQRVRRSP